MYHMYCPQDHEVTVEKYLSPEERKRQEEMARLEEEKRLAEMVGKYDSEVTASLYPLTPRSPRAQPPPERDTGV